MVKLLDNIIIKEKEYTYVDKFIYNDKEINCYLGDEYYLFSIIKEGKEYFIDDLDLINAIKENEGLNEQEYYYMVNPALNIVATDMQEMSTDNINKLKMAFLKLIKNSNIDVDEGEVLSRISKLNYINGTTRTKNINAFYHPVTNSIVIPTTEKLDTAIHELVHACGKRIFNITTSSITGFIEGATELTARRLMGDLEENGSYIDKLLFNSNLRTYPYQVAIMKQMEYLLNESVSEHILLGKTDFFNKFKEKYGNSLYRFLSHRSTRLIKMYNNKIDCTDYFLETQKKMYETVFDKEITNVNDINSANTYLEKLKGFEYMLGINPNDEKATGFIEYYENKLLEIEKKLEVSNIAKEDIEKLISIHQHKKVYFKNTITDSEAEIEGIINCASNIAKYIIKDKIIINPDEINYYMGTCGNDCFVYLVTNKDKPLYYCKQQGNDYTSLYKDSIDMNTISKTTDGFKTAISEDNSINLKLVDNNDSKRELIFEINNWTTYLSTKKNKRNDLLESEDNNHSFSR